MELKYDKELNNIIKKFVKPFGCKVKMDTDFAYYPEQKLLTWSPFVMNKADRYFNEYVQDNYPDIEADIFLWSLLHEVGHHMTYNIWSDDEFENAEKIKFWAETQLQEKLVTPTQERLCYLMYFSTCDEEQATKWAADYMDSHFERVEKFWKEFVDAYDIFLSENAIIKDNRED